MTPQPEQPEMSKKSTSNENVSKLSEEIDTSQSMERPDYHAGFSDGIIHERQRNAKLYAAIGDSIVTSIGKYDTGAIKGKPNATRYFITVEPEPTEVPK